MLRCFDVDIYGASIPIAVNKGYRETSGFPTWSGQGKDLL